MKGPTGDLRLPVFIVTGYLGSGKTTFLRRALDEAAFTRTLLLVNEAAALGVDDHLLRNNTGAVALLANGCLCCRIDRGVKEELHGVLALHRTRKDFDRVILELSGLADPLAVIATITSDRYLNGQLRIALVVTLVDGVHALESLDAAEHRRQIEAADVVLITKTDMAASDSLAAVDAHVARVQPLASRRPAVETQFGWLVEQAADLRADRIASSALAGRWRGESLRPALRRPTGAFACLPAEPETFCLRVEQPLEWSRLALWLSLLLHRHGDRILRIKGFLTLKGADAPVLINCVRHIAYFPEHMEREGDADLPSFLVFIVDGLPKERIVRSFAACVGEGVAAWETMPRQPEDTLKSADPEG